MTETQAFFEAIQAGNQAEVERLLDLGPALVNARNEAGASAVLLACYYQEPEIARLLIARGAGLDIFEAAAAGILERVVELVNQQPCLANAIAADGFQPLGLASFFGHEEVVTFLLSRGAEVNSASQNSQHVMPLHSAAAGRHLAIARRLLKHGADVNATQASDFTPLHAAAENGQLEMARLFLDHGAGVNARSSNGETVLAIALARGHHEVAAYLRQHGAVP